MIIVEAETAAALHEQVVVAKINEVLNKDDENQNRADTHVTRRAASESARAVLREGI